MEQISTSGFISEMILPGLNQILAFGMLVFYIIVTIYAVNSFRSSATTLLIIGVSIKILTFLSHLFLMNYIVRHFDHHNISGIFAISGIISVIGDFLFLLGIFKLFKLFYENDQIDE